MSMWRYTRTGKTVHALSRSTDRVAACGLGLNWFEDWYGTGNQTEYERAAALPECSRCVSQVGPRRKADS